MPGTEQIQPDTYQNPLQSRLYLVLSDAGLVQILANECRHSGYKARVFNNLEVMIKAAQVTPPDALIVEDDFIPEIKHISEITPFSGPDESPVPVVFLAQNDHIDHRLRAVHIGCSSFFSKPVNIGSFLNRIGQLCQRKRDNHESILVISDGSPTIEQTVSPLGSHHLTVNFLNDTADTLGTIAHTPPDLIIVNGDMTHISALDLAQIIRQEESFFGMPIVILTKRDKRLFDAQASEVGIDALIGLPIDEDDLSAICKSRIQRAKNLRREYQYLSKRDALTGLYNRHYFYEKLRQAVSLAEGKSSCGAIVYINISNKINNEHDLEICRRALSIELGNRLRTAVTPPGFTARIDDHGFAVLIYTTDEREIELQTESIKTALKKTEVTINDIPVHGEYEIGVSLIGSQTQSITDALDRAREASQIEKYGLPQADLNEDWTEHWTHLITQALNHERFRLVYQPIANLAGHPQSYYEVFMRMQDEYGTDILPHEFLVAAEKGGFSSQIDRWVIDQAVHVLAEQEKAGHDPTFFIKLFPASIDDEDLPLFLKQKISLAGADPSRIAIQLTQSAVNLRLSQTLRLCEQLRSEGIQIVIEHYGLHPDSEDIISKLPIDFVKIDGSLITDINLNQAHQQMVSTISTRVRESGARSIASLVQDASSLAILFQCGVDYIQGFFMQEPADVFSVDARLEHE